MASIQKFRKKKWRVIIRKNKVHITKVFTMKSDASKWAYMEVGVVAIGMSGVWRQFFNGLIIILAILGHRFHGTRIR